MSTDSRPDLDTIGALISDPATYQQDSWGPLFAKLRREDPVHFVEDSIFGPYWAITLFDDIREIETNYQTFSSDWRRGGITPYDLPPEFAIHGLMNVDPPEQSLHRDVVKVLGLPKAVASFEAQMRTTARDVIARLPREQEFDWVDRVSIEITSTMLAAMMGYPLAEGRQLVHWSDVATCFTDDADAPVSSESERSAALEKFAEVMTSSLQEHAQEPAAANLLSLIAHSDLMGSLQPKDRIDTLYTFLIGGNDTTRNTMTGGLWALWEYPQQHRRLRDTPSLIPSFVQESLRWQTAAMAMRRNIANDTVFRGRPMHKGDKVMLWYLSANRDESAIDRADEFIVDRERPGRHLAFGHGVHRCLGAKFAETQLRVFWEEFFATGTQFEVLAAPDYAYSSTLRTIRHLPVRLTS
jgi:cytochrome P450